MELDTTTDTGGAASELKEVRALVAGDVGSFEGADVSKEQGTPLTPAQSAVAHDAASSDAKFTFGNDDETPTPIPRKRKRMGGTAAKACTEAGAVLLESTKKGMDKIKAKKKKSLPVAYENGKGFVDDEAEDDDDNSSHDSNGGSIVGGKEDGEGVSLEALKRQILGRKIVTTPSAPFSNHKETYLLADKVMMIEPSNKTSSPMINGGSGGHNDGKSRYIIPAALRQELQCSICHETLYEVRSVFTLAFLSASHLHEVGH